MILDLLACPNCGTPNDLEARGGAFCNLACSREFHTKQEVEAAKEGAKARRFLAELKAANVKPRPAMGLDRDFLRVLGG